MASTFSRIITGELPARFIWQDEHCVAFLDAYPLTDGHTLVVPRKEVDEWTDTDDDLMAHIWRVVGAIGRAQKEAFGCRRAGVIIAGYEVPHLHVHTFPTNSMHDFAFWGKDRSPNPRRMDRAAQALRAALRDAGHTAQAEAPEPRT